MDPDQFFFILIAIVVAAIGLYFGANAVIEVRRAARQRREIEKRLDDLGFGSYAGFDIDAAERRARRRK